MSGLRTRWMLLVALAGCTPTGSVSPDSTQPTAVPWTDHVRIVGRHRPVGPETIRYGWPGTGVTVRFEGTELSLHMEDQARDHAVIVDGQPPRLLRTRPGERRYGVVEGLPPGEHEVTVLRRTEGHLGPTTLWGVEADGPLRPVPEPAARLEVIGDSITAGYGNEGDSQRCHYTPRTQNVLRSYAAIAAGAVGAELSAVAWSGKGVARNYGGDPHEPMPALYERSIPTEPDSRWAFEIAVDVVLINLGTNDFSTDEDPSSEQFVTAYVELLDRVRRAYPGAPILTTVAPMLDDRARGVAESYIDQAIAQRRHAGDADVRRIELHVDAQGYGCDWHPSAATHEAMAERLVLALQDALREALP